MLVQPAQKFSKCACAGKCQRCECGIQGGQFIDNGAPIEMREVVGNNPVSQELLLT